MSVFTALERTELEDFLAPYQLGRLVEYHGIAEGTENSNYFVSLEKGEFVLTLVERGAHDELPFVIDLLDILHGAGLAVPFALRTRDGDALRRLADKPALLQPRLPGRHVQWPNSHQCAEIGNWLARMHLTTADSPLERPSDRGLDWMLEQGPNVALSLPESHLPLLRQTLAELESRTEQLRALPRANLHADLFRDNALFEGGHLSGVIDFYNACSGPMLYDVAICVNDWCSEADGRLDPARVTALLGAYSSLRRFHPAEAQLWPTMLRVACLRFWLSRLIAAEENRDRGVLIKDPDEFRRLLEQRQQIDSPLPFAL